MMIATRPLLEVKELAVGFPQEEGIHWVLKNINFTLERGKTLALVGESGGGKTMASLAIMQLLPINAGVGKNSQILLEKQDLLNLSQRAMRNVRGKRIGMIFQEALVALNPVFTIGNQINEVLRCHFSFTKKQRQQRSLELLAEVGIPDPGYCARSYPHQLSGGMRQRAMIAIALAGEPDLLIADEPTTALDVTVQAQILDLLKSLQQKKQMSILFITHDLGVVAKMADDVVVLYQGEIVEQAKASDFFSQPQNEYSKKLFAALPSIHNRAYPPIALNAQSVDVLKVKDLKVYFPIQKGILKRTVGQVKAVDDVSFSLYAGHTLALVGESGSGKTTLGKSLIHLLKPTSGDIDFTMPMDSMQMIFQDPYSSLNPRMLIKDCIMEGMVAKKIGDVIYREKRVEELLELVGLPVKSKWRYPHEFSGGQRQRICIARSLAVNPKILICDEPTSSLDVSSQLQVLKLLQNLQKELNLSYLLITHNFAVVAYLADQVAVMYRGKIVEQGELQQVLMHPTHDYTKKLLSAILKV